MAIKISNNTIIDDSRVIVNASKVGVGTTNPGNTLTVLGDSNITGVTTSNYFDGFFPAGDKVYNENTTVNNGRVNVALESDIIVGSGKTLTVSTGSTIILNPFDFETSSVEELLIDKKLVVGFTSSFDVVTSGVGSVGVTSTRLVGFGTVLPPNIEVGLLVKPIPGIIGAGTTVVSFVAAGSSTGVSTITISPASLNTTVQENITFKFGTYGEKESAIILDGETGFIKSGSKISIGDVDLDASTSSIIISRSNSEKLRIDDSDRLLIGSNSSRSTGAINAQIQVEGTDANTSSISLTRNSADANPPYLVFSKTRSTVVGSAASVSNGDSLGQIRFSGDNGIDLNSVAAQITGEIDGQILTAGDASDMPGRLVFYTTPDGANASTEKMRITSGGNVGIGLTNATSRLHVSGNAIVTGVVTTGNGTLSSPAISIGSTLNGLYNATNTISVVTNGSVSFSVDPDQALVSTGTTAIPSLSFIGDTDTGIFRPGVNLIAVSAGANESLRVHSTGCGINTTSTTAGLYVQDDRAGYAAIFDNNGNAATRTGIRIICGTNDASGTNTAIAIDDGDGTNQGNVTFTLGTVSYGAFTANHDCIIPSYSEEIPYGSLITVNQILYKTNINGVETERGILYESGISTSPYAKNLLGAYSNPYDLSASVQQGSNLPVHQVLVLGDGHIRCCGENGNIKIGDGITSSSVEGVGMKMDKIGIVIGIAQENVEFVGDEIKLVAVQYGLHQYIPDNIAEYLESVVS